MPFLSKYVGDHQHGYWSLQYSRKLQYDGRELFQDPDWYYKHAPIIKWWEVKCELDWYRMQKESEQLANQPPRLVIK